MFTVREHREGDTLLLEGVYVEHPKAKYSLKTDSPDKCSICATGLDIKHTVSMHRCTIFLAPWCQKSYIILFRKIYENIIKSQDRGGYMCTVHTLAEKKIIIKPANAQSTVLSSIHTNINLSPLCMAALYAADQCILFVWVVAGTV